MSHSSSVIIGLPSIKRIPYAQLDETMKINFYGIWNTISILAPYMKELGGYIVNVSSIAGFIGVFGFTDYSASKFAIIGFSEALQSELRPHGIQYLFCARPIPIPLLLK